MIHACERPAVGRDVKIILGFLIAILLAVGPAGGYAVFSLGADKAQMAYLSFWSFDVAMYGMMLLPWLPLPSLRKHSRYDRFSLMIQFWIITYIFVVFSFEIPWVLGYEIIGKAENEMWAYPWWAYINGGDKRYLNPDLQVIFAESSACVVGIISAFAIAKWLRSGKRSVVAIHVLMFCAVLHISPTIQYYTLEIVQGFPNVDMNHPGNWLAKFILSNSCWLFMPFLTFLWGAQTLKRLYTGGPQGTVALQS